MDKIAFINGGTFIYWSSIILALAAVTAVAIYISVFLARGGKVAGLALSIPVAMALSLVLGRLMHWYSRTDAYGSFAAAMVPFSVGSYALMGAFIGCILTACVLRLVRLTDNLPKMLDAMAMGGGAGIVVGRLACLFNASDRGMVLPESVGFPFAYPVVNSVSGLVENRLATFMIQAMGTALILALLVVLLLIFRIRKKHMADGNLFLLFLLFYGPLQIVCDSTRYDSLFLRSNGFISIVQILGLAALLLPLIVFSVRMVLARGFRFWYIGLWVAMAGMMGGAGYMEYHVQRHGDQARFAYSVMSGCLVGVIVIVFVTYLLSLKKKEDESAEGAEVYA